MDEETEAPLDDTYTAQEDADADEPLVARSSALGSIVASTGG